MDVDFVRGIHCEKISHKMEAKKSKKPLMEKMRRARINDSLNELKCLVLDAMKKDASRYSKMEKADILEMTVKYLKSVQEKPQQTGAESLTKYRAGFNECAAEVTRYLMTTEHMNPRVRTELLSHLANSLTRSSPRFQQHPVLEATDKLTTATVTPQTSSNSQTPYSHARAVFPAGMHTQLVTAASFPASLPSPPSSPLGLEKVSSVPAQQIVLGGGIPAFIVPNDSFQLLPLTLQQSSPKVIEPWRPW